MPIIIISSDSKAAENEIAEKIIQAKNFQRLEPQILPEIESNYHINPGKLITSLENTPSLLKKIVSNQWQYHLACIESEVLTRLMADNIVCWGLAAHLYVTDVSHALKVRIIHNNQYRIKKIAEQQGVSDNRARKVLEMELINRKKWSMAAYNMDETDPSHYDLAVNLNQIELNEAVVTITGAVSYRKFQSITYSRKTLADLALSAKVRTTLLKSMSDVHVQAKDGTVLVYTKVFKQNKLERVKQIKELAGRIDGVNCVEVHVIKNLFVDTAEAVNQA